MAYIDWPTLTIEVSMVPYTGQRFKHRHHAGKSAETVRQPEPKKKAPRKAAKKKAPKRSAKSKKVVNILVPGLNPPRGDMRNFLEQQRQLYGG